MIERLAEDHSNARRLARGLSQIPGIDIDPGKYPTNQVYFKVVDGPPPDIAATAREASGSRAARATERGGSSPITASGPRI